MLARFPKTNANHHNGYIGPYSGEYQIATNVNIYDSRECVRLATQANIGRHLRILTRNIKCTTRAIGVRLCEDGYSGWLAAEDLNHLKTAKAKYQAANLAESEIKARMSDIIKFAHSAMAQTNHYLWGGTLSPNYDCSGFVQAAFASVGIWIPRDAYQQEDFSKPIQICDLEPGDLIFFGSAHRTTHVGLCIRESKYIHSSGREDGRDGIGIDRLASPRSRTSQWLFAKLRCAGRIVKNLRP